MKKLMLTAAVALSGCSSGRNYAQAIAALVDVSGTYGDQKPEVINLIKKGILPKLNPGDSLLVIRMDDESYRRDNLGDSVSLTVAPPTPNLQKLAFTIHQQDF